MGFTSHQRRLLKELDEIVALVDMDIRTIGEYESHDRVIRLAIIKDKLIRGEVIGKYTLIDEYLTNIICNYHFQRPKKDETYGRLWKTKRFRLFVHYIMDETYLSKKLNIVNAIGPVPKDVRASIMRINDVRNDLAHSFFPQNRRRHMAIKTRSLLNFDRVLYDGVALYTTEGVQKFHNDVDIACEYLSKRC
jgi:hypothetical protein